MIALLTVEVGAQFDVIAVVHRAVGPDEAGGGDEVAAVEVVEVELAVVVGVALPPRLAQHLVVGRPEEAVDAAVVVAVAPGQHGHLLPVRGRGARLVSEPLPGLPGAALVAGGGKPVAFGKAVGPDRPQRDFRIPGLVGMDDGGGELPVELRTRRLRTGG